MKEIEQLVYHFLEYVTSFHRCLIDTYNLEVYPTYNEAGRLYPRKGELTSDGKTFNYNYHGSGCTLIVDGVIVDYDLDVLNVNKIKISDWKFNRFIESYSKNKSNISIDDLDGIFVQLTQKKALEQKDSSIMAFTINESFFESYILS